LYADPPIRIEYQTEDSNTKPRAREKVKVKEYVDPADLRNNEKFELEKEREDLKSAEEFCLFTMRMKKHL